ncbi:histidine biosynthesis protein, HisA-like protein [Azospirillum sp. YIM B02556]|uniref:Histidine biosynthesis protein, HisA-like protein n=1 Tax=Azospirillum endophyticum TaxID=2800326 RepID=A0ABS1FH50_9PROT|nr:HisA/HisF-related TIM barrel protein [Azospirillum endophyticum]MBK1842727.1 histidine biosynthesis protein, HisA-like protein [Azospirillum endophyticum]
MDIVPVIDLLGGQVVHAKRGERDRYRPIESALTPGSAPQDIVAALLALQPFRACYVADLDAIRGNGDHRATVAALQARWPAVAFWIDAGLATPDDCRRWLDAGLRHLVIGSESQTDGTTLEAALALTGEDRVALSLDVRQGEALGPAALHEDAGRWPARVIAMTLDRVGSGEGPDLDRIAALAARRPGVRVWGAGGVRDAADLDALAAHGTDAVLVASALHDRRLDAGTLARFASETFAAGQEAAKG